MKYKLGIRDLRPKHAGNYTIVLSNTKHGLYENLTMQLVVTGKHLLFLNNSVAVSHYDAILLAGPSRNIEQPLTFPSVKLI